MNVISVHLSVSIGLWTFNSTTLFLNFFIGKIRVVIPPYSVVLIK